MERYPHWGSHEPSRKSFKRVVLFTCHETQDTERDSDVKKGLTGRLARSKQQCDLGTINKVCERKKQL